MSVQTSKPDDDRYAEEEQTNEPALEKDDVFHLLQSGRRRAVLRYFAIHPDRDTFEMRTVAEEVAAWENETTVEQITSDQRQRVYIALYQSHLPKLDEYGVIDYNQPRGTIEPTERTALFRPYIEDEFRTDRAPERGAESGAFGFGPLKQLLNR